MTRARAAVSDTVDLLAEDLLTGTNWLDLRKQQDAGRSFGPAATGVWSEFRKILPFKDDGTVVRTQPIHDIAAAFIRDNPAIKFYGANDREPDSNVRRHITQ